MRGYHASCLPGGNMVEFRLPETLPRRKGKDLAQAGQQIVARIPGLSLESRRRTQSPARHLLRRYERLRAHGSGWSDLDQEQHRLHADIQAVLPRRRVRLLLDECRRPEHARLHQVHERGRSERRAAARAALAASASGQGPRSRPDEFLRTARIDRTLAANRVTHTTEGMATEP